MEQHEHTDVQDYGTDSALQPQLTEPEICYGQALDPGIVAKTGHAHGAVNTRQNISGSSEHARFHSHYLTCRICAEDETNSSRQKEDSPCMMCRSVENNEDCAGSMTMGEIGHCANCNACEEDCIQCSSCGCDCGGRQAFQNSSGRVRTIIPLALTVMSVLEQQPNYCPAKLHEHFTDVTHMCRDIGRDLADVVSVLLQELKVKLLGQSDAGAVCSSDFENEATNLQAVEIEIEAERGDQNGGIASNNSADNLSKAMCEEVLVCSWTANEAKHASKVISEDENWSTEDICTQDIGFSDGQLGVPPSNADTGTQDPDAIIMTICDGWSPEDTLYTSLAENSEEEEEIPGKIFVGNIGYRQNWRDVKDFFSKFGNVAYVYLVQDHIKKLSRGIGFVEFVNPQDAEKCLMADSKELVLEGRVLRVGRASESKRTTFRMYPKRQQINVMEEDRDEESNSFDVDRLPDVVWRIIFSYLTLQEQVRLERVSKSWRAVALHQWGGQRRLRCTGFTMTQPMTERVLGSLLQRCSDKLVDLDLSAAGRLLTSYSMCIIGHFCPHLQKLNMSGVNATNLAMRDLSENTIKLKWIKMQRCLHVGEKGLWWLLKNCQELEYVDVSSNSAVTGKCFYMIGPKIKTLILNDCNNLTDFGIIVLAKRCLDIEDLRIQNCTSLTDAAIDAVVTMEHLKKLIIGGNFKNASYVPWARMGNLHKLQYLNADFNQLITDEAVQSIVSGCPQLSFLNLSGCRPYVSQDSIQDLAQLSNLQYLNLSYLENVTSNIVDYIAESCPLQYLILRGCPNIDDEIGLVLQSRSTLRLLDISGNYQVGKFSMHVLSFLSTWDYSRSVEVVVGGTSIMEVGEKRPCMPDNIHLVLENRSSHRLHPHYMLDLPEMWGEDDFEDGEEEWEDEEEGVEEGEGGFNPELIVEEMIQDIAAQNQNLEERLLEDGLPEIRKQAPGDMEERRHVIEQFQKAMNCPERALGQRRKNAAAEHPYENVVELWDEENQSVQNEHLLDAAAARAVDEPQWDPFKGHCQAGFQGELWDAARTNEENIGTCREVCDWAGWDSSKKSPILQNEDWERIMEMYQWAEMGERDKQRCSTDTQEQEQRWPRMKELVKSDSFRTNCELMLENFRNACVGISVLQKEYRERLGNKVDCGGWEVLGQLEKVLEEKMAAIKRLLEGKKKLGENGFNPNELAATVGFMHKGVVSCDGATIPVLSQPDPWEDVMGVYNHWAQTVESGRHLRKPFEEKMEELQKMFKEVEQGAGGTKMVVTKCGQLMIVRGDVVNFQAAEGGRRDNTALAQDQRAPRKPSTNRGNVAVHQEQSTAEEELWEERGVMESLPGHLQGWHPFRALSINREAVANMGVKAGTEKQAHSVPVSSYSLSPSQTDVCGQRPQTSVWEGERRPQTPVWEGGKRLETNSWERGKRLETNAWEGGKRLQTDVWEGGKRLQTDVWEGGKRLQTDVWEGGKRRETDVWEGVWRPQTAVWEGERQPETAVWEGDRRPHTSLWQGVGRPQTAVLEGDRPSQTHVWDGERQVQRTVLEGDRKQEPSGSLEQWHASRAPGMHRVAVAKEAGSRPVAQLAADGERRKEEVFAHQGVWHPFRAPEVHGRAMFSNTGSEGIAQQEEIWMGEKVEKMFTRQQEGWHPFPAPERRNVNRATGLRRGLYEDCADSAMKTNQHYPEETWEVGSLEARSSSRLLGLPTQRHPPPAPTEGADGGCASGLMAVLPLEALPARHLHTLRPSALSTPQEGSLTEEETQTQQPAPAVHFPEEEIWECEKVEAPCPPLQPWPVQRGRGAAGGGARQMNQRGSGGGHFSSRAVCVPAGYEDSDDDCDIGDVNYGDFLDADDPQAMERWDMS